MARSSEKVVATLSGWLVLPLLLAMAVGCYALIQWSVSRTGVESAWGLVGGILLSLVWLVLLCGFFTLQPNQCAVLLLFGAYRGTCRDTGFRWVNPLVTHTKVSLRARNLNGQKLKVNDKLGNPIEIAAVVVWRVSDSAQAVFDVDDYHEYVQVQSESAVRHLASQYPYDTSEHEQMSLRGNIDEVSVGLQQELSERFIRAGVIVDEARLSHLAYAPEIAGAMLRRQQAEAIVAARARMVDGAVGMVEMALEKLEKNESVKLDNERKAVMVSNLLVVLCGDREASPVINAGTLY